MSAAQVTEATVKELCDVAQLAVELAKKAGADDAEVLVRDGSELTTKVRLGEPELVQEAGSRALGLRVLKGGKRSTTYTSDLRRDALEALCAESVALAELAERDDFALPPDRALLATQLPELDLYDPEVAEVDAAWALKQAIAGEAAARRHDKRVTNSEGATWSRVLGATAFATSGGFVGGYRGSYASLVVEPLCDDTTDPTNPKKRNGYWWTSPRSMSRRQSASRPRAARSRPSARERSRRRNARSCSTPRSPDRSSGPSSRSRMARRSGASRRTSSAARAPRSRRSSSRSSMIR